MDCAEEGGCGFVVAGCDSSVMFQFFKEILDQVTRFVERLVIVAWHFSIGFRRNDRGDSRCFQPVDDTFIGVISLVGDQDIGLNFIDQRIGSVQIAGLSRCQVKAGRIAQSIADRVDFGAQPAP